MLVGCVKKGAWITYKEYQGVSALAMDSQYQMWVASEEKPLEYVIKTVDSTPNQTIL